MTLGRLIAPIAFSLVLVGHAAPAARRCGRVCRPAIGRCVGAGYRRRACRREFLHACRQFGPEVCIGVFLPATTTTIVLATTTTTSATMPTVRPTTTTVPATVPAATTLPSTTTTTTTTTITVPPPECTVDTDCPAPGDINGTFCDPPRCVAGTCVPGIPLRCPDRGWALWYGDGVGAAIEESGPFTLRLCFTPTVIAGVSGALVAGELYCPPLTGSLIFPCLGASEALTGVLEQGELSFDPLVGFPGGGSCRVDGIVSGLNTEYATIQGRVACVDAHGTPTISVSWSVFQCPCLTCP